MLQMLHCLRKNIKTLNKKLRKNMSVTFVTCYNLALIIN